MTIIIAEAGVNHNGEESLAIELVDAAAEAGADIVKFQTFKSDQLVTKSAKQATYQAKNTGRSESQLEMLSKLELSYDSFYRIKERCDKNKIEFLSTAFDVSSLEFLVNDLQLKKFKISSGDLTNSPLLLEHAKYNCELILSTGMSTLEEIKTALMVIKFAYVNPNKLPSLNLLEDSSGSSIDLDLLKDKVTLLHCTSDYPAQPSQINLNAIKTLKEKFELDIGYSDHSLGDEVAISAVALGASVIEKHFTLDKSFNGPDHKASLSSEELKTMIRKIRNIEVAMGDGVKAPLSSEEKNINIVRKSIVASKDIAEGSIFSKENIAIKRPGDGMNPIIYWDLLGKISSKSYKIDDQIDEKF